jgi:hypothetical protein
MSDRIRNLEEALQVLQSSCSTDSHPLLATDLLNIKSALTLYGEAQTGAAHSPDSAPPPGDLHDYDEPPPVESPSSNRPSSEDILTKDCQAQVTPNQRIQYFCLSFFTGCG